MGLEIWKFIKISKKIYFFTNVLNILPIILSFSESNLNIDINISLTAQDVLASKNDIGVLLDNEIPNLDVRENRNWWHLRRNFVIKINTFHIHLFFLCHYFKDKLSRCTQNAQNVWDIRFINKTINLPSLLFLPPSSELASISLSLFVLFLAIVLNIDTGFLDQLCLLGWWSKKDNI